MPRPLFGSPEPSGNNLIGHISTHRILEASFARNPSFIIPSLQGEENRRTNQAQLAT